MWRNRDTIHGDGSGIGKSAGRAISPTARRRDRGRANHEIHLCGSARTDIRRLGVEYLSTYAEAPAEQTLWWYGSVITALEAVPSGPRTGMLLELKGLIELLAQELEQQGG